MTAAMGVFTNHALVMASTAWIKVTSEDELEPLPGTWTVQSTVEKTSTLWQVFSIVNLYLVAQKPGDTAVPIVVPRDVAKVTAIIDHGQGVNMATDIPVMQEISPEKYMNAEIWFERTHEILPSHQRTEYSKNGLHFCKGEPVVCVRIKTSAVHAWYRHAAEKPLPKVVDQTTGASVCGGRFFYPESPRK